MTSIKVPKSHFTGASHVYSGGPDGLATIIRGLAIDMARVKLQSASVADFVDNSTGAAAAALVDLADSATVFNASAAGGVAYAALNTSIGKIKDAQKVITNRVNIARTLIGLTTVTVTEGNEAAAGTVPAVDKVGTAANGAGTVTYASYVAAVQVIKANQRKLERAINELLTAQGITNITIAWTGSVSSDFTLAAIPAVAASVDGTVAVAKTAVDAFLTAYANNLATLAAKWNAAFTQANSYPLSVVAG